MSAPYYDSNEPATGALARAQALEWGVEEWNKVQYAWGRRCQIYVLEGENTTRCAKCNTLNIFRWDDDE